MSDGLIHIRRSHAARAECDHVVHPPRELVDSRDDATCPECIAAFDKRTAEWHAALARTIRPPWNRGKKKK